MVSPILIILGLAMLGGVAYIAIARDSSPKLRLAALGALGLMVVTAIICLLIILKASNVPVTYVDPEQVLLPDANPPVVENNTVLPTVLLILFLIAVFVLALVVSRREQKRSGFNETDDKPRSNQW